MRLCAWVCLLALLVGCDEAPPIFDGEGTHGCRQLELAVGLRGAECGKLTQAELAEIKADQEG
ncbi:MAG: hypothetical protein AAFY59_12390 [Pseudomonadota bacterium]